MTNLEAKFIEPYIVVNGRKIGSDYPTYIMGEVGINHNGSVEIAKYLIDLCVKYGADCVKFQKRDYNNLYPKRILKDLKNYDQQTQYTIFAQQRAELSFEELKYLKKYTESKGLIIFKKKMIYKILFLLSSSFKKIWSNPNINL